MEKRIRLSDSSRRHNWAPHLHAQVRSLPAFFAVLLLAGLSVAEETEAPFAAALDGAAIIQNDLADPVRKSILLGNGDVTGLLFTESGRLTLNISKNDVWDARIDTSQDPELLKIDVKSNTTTGSFKGPGSWNKPYPAPWICGKLIFEETEKVSANERTAATAAGEADASRLDIRRAVARVELANEGHARATATVRSLAQENAFLIESDTPVVLMPNSAPHTPAARKESRGNAEWIVQQLPADEDWSGMSYAIALARDGKRHAVAIVTSFESESPVESALAAARRILNDSDQETIDAHELEWQRFWSASGLSMDDKELQDIWYQNLYFLRCVSKPGAKAVGLYAGSGKNSYMWHGSHTLNYNSQQTFWGGFNANHVELADPFIQMIHRYLPRAKWFARQVYDLDGAHFPHNIFTHEPPDPEKCVSRNHHMHAFPPYAYTLGVSGHIVHVLWARYLYSPDRAYLENTAYPVIKEVAVFYASLIEQCKRDEAGKAIIGPSYNPEHGPFGTSDNPYDLSLMRLTLGAAITSAELLDMDQDLVKRFRRNLALVPPYPTANHPGLDNQPVVVNWRGAGASFGKHNISVPTIPVFPGDQVTWFSPDAEKKLFARTVEHVRWNGNNAMIMLAVARARLSMPGTSTWLKEEILARRFPNGTIALNRRGASFNGAGIYTEQFASSAAISELLLQSVDNIIRIFPAWPNDKDASFSKLRAQGGFLVTAEQKDGKVRRLEVVSTVGGTLRVLNPWTGQIDERETQPMGKVVFTP